MSRAACGLTMERSNECEQTIRRQATSYERNTYYTQNAETVLGGAKPQTHIWVCLFRDPPKEWFIQRCEHLKSRPANLLAGLPHFETMFEPLFVGICVGESNQTPGFLKGSNGFRNRGEKPWVLPRFRTGFDHGFAAIHSTSKDRDRSLF